MAQSQCSLLNENNLQFRRTVNKITNKMLFLHFSFMPLNRSQCNAPTLYVYLGDIDLCPVLWAYVVCGAAPDYKNYA